MCNTTTTYLPTSSTTSTSTSLAISLRWTSNDFAAVDQTKPPSTKSIEFVVATRIRSAVSCCVHWNSIGKCLPRWIPLLRYYQFTLVSLRVGGHWNRSWFGGFIIMRRQAKKKKKRKKINPTCIDDTLHVIFGRPFHMARQNAGEAETSTFRMDDWSFVLTRPIYTVYIRHPGPWLLAGRNGKSVMDRSLPSSSFSFLSLSLSLSERYSFFFLIFGAIPLFPTFSSFIQPSYDKKDESDTPTS